MLKKISFLILIIAGSPIFFSFITKEKKQKILKTIIIDAGHGGKDVGARGVYSSEKDICLAVSLKLGEQLKKDHPEINILYTRITDSYPELYTRANFANQNKGDLFISIHVNAAPPKKVSEVTGYKYVGSGSKRKKVPTYRTYSIPNPAMGTETYIWGAHKNEDKEVAIRENASMFNEENYEKKYGTVDVTSPEFIALSLLKTKQYFKRSATLAGYVEEEFNKVGRVSRGQKQRQVGIWVLQATAMPSVLVETGYITNKSEEDYLNSSSGQYEIVDCINKALKSYVDWLEKNQISTETNRTSQTKILTEKNTDSFLKMIDDREKARFSK
jgi:N-acetylmuramoyl-L-alanine amidase